ncbi:MAG: AAA family ATPase [Anaerolineae bacterium]|nr:AAA family ATPase [Anaerolineae bacterium]
MEVIVFIGIQGSGKTTFYQQQFFKTHLRLSLDMLKTRHRETILLRACIDSKTPFVVDNTNPTLIERSRYIQPARAAHFTVTGYYFVIESVEAVRHNAARQGKERVPDVAVYSTHARLEPPTLAEGFDQLYTVTHGENGLFIVAPIMHLS